MNAFQRLLRFAFCSAYAATAAALVVALEALSQSIIAALVETRVRSLCCCCLLVVVVVKISLGMRLAFTVT